MTDASALGPAQIVKPDSYEALRLQLELKRPRDVSGVAVCGGCRGPVSGDAWNCAACAAKNVEDARARELDLAIIGGLMPARSSLPSWGWARVGDALFAERVADPRLRGVARAWVPDRGSLMISGASGVGKTATLHAIADRLLRAAESAARAARTLKTPLYQAARCIRWVSALDLVAARRGHALGRGEAPLWEGASHSSILFIDELGQEQAHAGWLLEMLDSRYRRGARTLTSSGLPRAELEGRYGSGACRRLIEPGGAFLDLFGSVG